MNDDFSAFEGAHFGDQLRHFVLLRQPRFADADKYEGIAIQVLFPWAVLRPLLASCRQCELQAFLSRCDLPQKVNG